MPEIYETVLVRPYCTLQSVQEVTGNSEEDGIEKTLRSINEASRLIEDQCGAGFWFYDHTSTPFKVPQGSVIGKVAFLPFPVLSLTEVTVDGIVVDLAETDIDVGEPYVSSLVTDWGGSPFSGKMLIKGTFGYVMSPPDPNNGLALPPSNLPESVRRACMLMAASMSGLWHRERVGIDGEKTTMLETRIPAEVDSLLSKWNRRGDLVGF